MSETLQQLLIKIDATTEQARREIAKLEKGVDSSTKTIEARTKRIDAALAQMDKKFTALARAGVAAFAVGAVAAAKSGLQFAGGLGELSEATGVSTDMLQTLNFAASQTGLRFEQVTEPLSKLTKRVGEANAGNAQAIETFQRLGIAYRDASGQARSTDDVLADLSDRLAAMKTPAERAAAATRLFEEAGTKLLPILSQGTKGLKSYADEAERLGLILPAEKIKQADEAGDRLAKTMLVLKMNTASAVAGPLTDLLHLMDDIGRKFDETGGAFRAWQGLGQDAGEGLRNFLSGASRPRDTVGGGGGGGGWGGAAGGGGGGGWGDDAVVPIPAFPGDRTAPMVGNIGPGTPSDRLTAWNAWEESIAESSQKLSDTLRKLEFDAQKALGGIGGAIRTDLVHDIDLLERELNDLNASQADVWEATSNLMLARSREMKEALDNLAEKSKETDLVFDNWLRNTSDDFADVILKAESLGDVLKNLALQLAKSELSNILYGAFGGTGKVTSIAGKLLGFADGGVPPVGVPSIVGERGPELFIPKTSGRIVPNHALGGTTINNYQTIAPNFAGNAATKQDLIQMAAMTKQAAMDGVAQAVRRGGAYAQAVRGR